MPGVQRREGLVRRGERGGQGQRGPAGGEVGELLVDLVHGRQRRLELQFVGHERLVVAIHVIGDVQEALALLEAADFLPQHVLARGQVAAEAIDHLGLGLHVVVIRDEQHLGDGFAAAHRFDVGRAERRPGLRRQRALVAGQHEHHGVIEKILYLRLGLFPLPLLPPDRPVEPPLQLVQRRKLPLETAEAFRVAVGLVGEFGREGKLLPQRRHTGFPILVDPQQTVLGHVDLHVPLHRSRRLLLPHREGVVAGRQRQVVVRHRLARVLRAPHGDVVAVGVGEGVHLIVVDGIVVDGVVVHRGGRRLVIPRGRILRPVGVGVLRFNRRRLGVTLQARRHGKAYRDLGLFLVAPDEQHARRRRERRQHLLTHCIGS